MTLLRSNSDLRRDRIWNWTIPASTTVLPAGRRHNCCPAADGCVLLCYARTGTYRFPAVVASHQRNLMRVLDDIDGWATDMIEELGARRFRPTEIPRVLPIDLDHDPWARSWADAGGAAVRIHDAGDFFSDSYLEAWLAIARAVPDVLFYCYTKEVPRFRSITAAPDNFRWCYSYGGRHDHLIDPDVDRHADVFPDDSTLAAAGYVDQTPTDLIAVLAPTTRVGIPANNHPHIRRRMAGETFGEIQVRRTNRRDTTT